MTSLFRKLGKKSDKSSSGKGDSENKSPTGFRRTPVTSQQIPNPNNNAKTKDDNVFVEQGEEPPELQLPISRKKERNMSISKSGRHKFKGRQRGSVLSQELYNGGSTSTETSPTGPAAAPRTLGGGWDAPLSLSTSQPTSV